MAAVMVSAAAEVAAEQVVRAVPLRTAMAYPPMKAALEEWPRWREGERYEVVLGRSFESPSEGVSGENGGGGSLSGGRGGDGEAEGGGPRQYVHLKYDFLPGRTNLDVPATLRQRPLTGADGKTNRDGQRWAAEMEYESRDSENPRPVIFRGDASRCVGARWGGG